MAEPAAAGNPSGAPSSGATPSPQPAQEPTSTVQVGLPLDLPGKFGAGWTVTGSARDGSVVLTRPSGDGVETTTISQKAFDLVKQLRANRGRRPLKRFYRSNEILLPGGTATIMAVDGAGKQMLVSGSSRGTFFQKWVPASLVNDFASDADKTRSTQAFLDTVAPGVLTKPERTRVETERKKEPEKPSNAKTTQKAAPGKTVQVAPEGREPKLADKEEAATVKALEPELSNVEIRMGGAAMSTLAGLRIPSIVAPQKGNVTVTVPQTINQARELLRVKQQESFQQGQSVQINAQVPGAQTGYTIGVTGGAPAAGATVPSRPSVQTAVPSELSVKAEEDPRQALLTKAQNSLAVLQQQIATKEAEYQGLQNRQIQLTDQINQLQTRDAQAAAPGTESDELESLLEQRRDLQNQALNLRAGLVQPRRQAESLQSGIETLSNESLPKEVTVELAQNLQPDLIPNAAPAAALLSSRVTPAQNVPSTPSAPSTTPTVQPPTQIPIGTPSVAAGRRAPPPRPERGIMDRMKGRFAKPVILAAALSAGQQFDTSQEGRESPDAYEQAIGTEGGRAAVAPRVPSYTSSATRTPGERERDIQETDLERIQKARAQTEQMQRTRESLLGPEEEVTGGEAEEEGGIHGVEVPGEEEGGLSPEDLTRQARALQDAQQRAALEQQRRSQAEEAATIAAGQATLQATDEKTAQDKQIWQMGTGAIATTGVGILVALIVKNIQLLNKMFFHNSMIPPTDFPVEDALIVGADLLILTAGVLLVLAAAAIPAAVASFAR